MNNHWPIFCMEVHFHFFLSKYLKVECPDIPLFWKWPMFWSVPFNILTSDAWVFQPCTAYPTHTQHGQSLASLIDRTTDLLSHDGLICIFLMLHSVEHLLLSLSAVCIYCSVKYTNLFPFKKKSCCIFSYCWVWEFFISSWYKLLVRYILCKNFLPACDWFFILLKVSWGKKRTFSFWESTIYPLVLLWIILQVWF